MQNMITIRTKYKNVNVTPFIVTHI